MSPAEPLFPLASRGRRFGEPSQQAGKASLRSGPAVEPRTAGKGSFSQTGPAAHTRGARRGKDSLTDRAGVCAKLRALPFTCNSAEPWVAGTLNLRFRDGGLSLSNIGKPAPGAAGHGRWWTAGILGWHCQGHSRCAQTPAESAPAAPFRWFPPGRPSFSSGLGSD